MGVPIACIGSAARQGGCVSRDQLIDSGISPRTLDRMVSAGVLLHATADVYRIIPSTGWLDDVKAAVLALPGAVASHHAAAAVHEFPRLRPIPTVTVHTRTTHEFLGVVVRRAHDLAPSHLTAVSDLPVTTPARTVVDLAAVLHPRHLEAIIQDLVLDARLDLGETSTTLSDVARRGKPGVRSLRSTLEKLGTTPVPMSVLERKAWTMLVNCGLADGNREYAIPWEPTKRFDVAWPEARLAVEWDSRRWHGALERMTYDRRRDRTAALNGWLLLRFTWDEVTTRPSQVVTDIRTMLQQRRSTA